MGRWRMALMLGAVLAAQGDARPPRRPTPAAWTASWGSAQIALADRDALPATASTLRQVVRLSAGGDRVRIRLSNLFGTTPLAIGAAHVARGAAGSSRIGAGVALTFGGRAGAVIPAGGELRSDAVTLAVAPGSDLAISLYLPDRTTLRTGQPGARATGFVTAGRHVADPDLPAAARITRWHAIADVEVAGRAGGTVVAIGDSITEGYGATIDANTRWPDTLAARLRPSGMGLVNAGIGGNRVLADGLGPSLLARFDRDVIDRAGVRFAIVTEGVNDLGTLSRAGNVTPARHAAIVADITAAYRALVIRAHARGITVFGGTIMPFVGNDYYHPDAGIEADRQAINAFIRASGLFDGVVDFDRATRDPARPDRLAPAYDSGDHLHPSDAGYRAMGAAVPLALFADAARVDPRPAIALTFDDLPAHGPLPAGETRLGVVQRIAAALARAKAPAFGFLNAGFGRDDPGSAPATAAWRAAGLPLGNHTFAHDNIDAAGVPAFLADVARNEAPLAAVAGGSDWHWFRYPFLSEGRTPAIRDAVRAALGARGYRAAAVTMSFNDFKWNPPYAACRAKRDTAAVARLEAGFLADARAAALDARARARAQLGRDVPYVLLMHAGSFDAHMLPRLLALYRAMGFRFVTLAEAQADPYYAAANDLTLPGPTPSLAGPAPTPVLAGPPAGPCA